VYIVFLFSTHHPGTFSGTASKEGVFGFALERGDAVPETFYFLLSSRAEWHHSLANDAVQSRDLYLKLQIPHRLKPDSE